MTTYANIQPSAAKPGVLYASASPVPTTEADLYNISPANVYGAPPVPLVFQQAVFATVSLTFVSGATGTTYVVLETDLSDDKWIDLAWIVTSNTTAGTLLWAVSAGVAGADAAAQTRANNSAPASTGSVQMPLGGRFRFTGKTGTAGKVTATISYQLLPLR